jgi:hypothetical protein
MANDTMKRLRAALVDHFGPSIDQIDDVTPLFSPEADTQIGRALGDTLDRWDLRCCIEREFEIELEESTVMGEPTLASLVMSIDAVLGAC